MDGIVNKIVVATDLSDSADLAISRAIEIAKTTKANITILHVIQKKSVDRLLDSTLNNLLPKGLWLTTEEYVANLLKDKIRALSRHKLDINHIIISTGRPAVKILQYVRKNKVDMLIIGAHGKYSIRDTFVGTTAEYIADRTRCPVLIVKNSSQKPYKKILAPVDFSDLNKSALAFVYKLFSKTDIHLIHVGDYEYEDILKREEQNEGVSKNKINIMRKAIIQYLDTKMEKFLKKSKMKIGKSSYAIKLGYPGPVIINESHKLNPDLIVMGAQGHGRLHYLFIGSVAKWVLEEIDKDVLLIPPTQ